MVRSFLPSAILATALFGVGCGADAGEDAPPIATGVVIAQAPPNAVGADVPRPGTPSPPAVGTTPRPPPIKVQPTPLPTGASPAPLPHHGGTTPKGTEL